MTEVSASPIRRRIRDFVTGHASGLAVGIALLAIGLYPGPTWTLLRDPAWQTDLVVARLRDERAFWITGALILVGPAIVFANMVPRGFDSAWLRTKNMLAGIGDRMFVGGVAVFAVCAAAAAAFVVFAKKPITSDEVAQLWHARILLSGRLYLPPDPNAEFFAVDNIIDVGRWYSQFPIGGPAALALAMSVGGAWLLNPVLAGLTVVNVHRFSLNVYGRGEARVAALLCATCPFLLLMSGSYMNHTVVTFLATTALAQLPIWTSSTNRRRQRASIVIGLSLGSAIAVRPLDGAVATVALGGLIAFEGVRSARLRDALLAIVAGALPLTGLLVSNWLTTGHPTLLGYEVLWGANHSLGFHLDPTGNPHTPSRAVLLATAYLMQLNWALFEWPVAGLIVLGIALAFIGKPDRWTALLLAWAGGQLAAYASYWHAGIFLGPRYLFTVIPALLIVVARGLVLAETQAPAVIRRSIVATIAVSIAFSWVVPATPVGAIGAAAATRPMREAMKVDLKPVLTSLQGSKSLVFVNEPASSRLIRRLWGLGVSRPDAARLVATKDNCALLEAVVNEAGRVGTIPERVARLEATRPYSHPPGRRFTVRDPAFRVSGPASVTPRCRADLIRDGRDREAISYGTALLMNEIGPDGEVAGSVVFVADLGDHNEVLRARFANRRWFRLELRSGAGEQALRVVPY